MKYDFKSIESDIITEIKNIISMLKKQYKLSSKQKEKLYELEQRLDISDDDNYTSHLETFLDENESDTSQMILQIISGKNVSDITGIKGL